MAITLVQSKIGAVGGSPSSVGMVFTNAQTIGNMIIVVAAFLGTNTITQTVADTVGNNYLPATVRLAGGGAGSSMEIFYAYRCKAAGAGANTVTVTFSSAVLDTECAIHEYTGFGGAAVTIDTTYSAFGLNEGNPATSTLVTAGANEFLFAADVNNNQYTASNWNTRVNDSSLGGLITADLISGALGTYTFQATTGGTLDNTKQAVAFIIAGLDTVVLNQGYEIVIS